LALEVIALRLLLILHILIRTRVGEGLRGVLSWGWWRGIGDT
jgi:hypothetical protein